MKKLVCPYCGGKFRLEEATTEALYYEFGKIDGKFGRHWPAVDEYIDCFAQTEHGTVSIKRRVRIAGEILRLFEAQKFEYQGKRYRTSREEIIRAMLEICNAGKWGFRNHNYLKVMLKKSAERISAEGLTAKEEQAREGRRVQGAQSRANKNESTVDDYKARHGIKSLLDKIGREG
ncbi:hypothetical protein ES703_35553 [subsurface metagenome]